MTDKIGKADRCKRLIEDPDLKQAFQDVRDALHRKFEECPTTDADGMVDIRKRLHLLDSVQANLVAAIEDGQLEAFRSEQERPWLSDLTRWRPSKKQRTA